MLLLLLLLLLPSVLPRQWKRDALPLWAARHCAQARDALARVVYGTLFDELVTRINDASRGPEDAHVIGILDIFGFEKLTTNSFEQLCINYVNEMLQEQFHETVLAAERRLL